MPRRKEDENLFVKFYMHPVHLVAESEKQGRPIYQDVEFVSIIIPGDATMKGEFKVTDVHRERFPDEYASFKRGEKDMVINGTPVSDWPVLTASQREELKAMKFFTVESIAGASDAQISRIGMGAMELRTKAKAFLAVSADSAVVQTLSLDNERLKAENDRLTKSVADLASRIEAVEKAPRGRAA